jgi:hypothetical protein
VSTISLAALCERWGVKPEHARVRLHRADVKPMNPGRRGYLRYRLEDVEAAERQGGIRRNAELDPWAILDEAEAVRRLE